MKLTYLCSFTVVGCLSGGIIQAVSPESSERAAYRTLAKTLTPASAQRASSGYEAARVFSGLVPMTVGAVGVHQLLKGNGATGLALLAGASGLALVRAVLLRKMLISNGLEYGKKLEIFMADWPENKALVPEPMHDTFNRFKEMFSTGAQRVNGEDIGAILDTMDTISMLKKIKGETVVTEARKWAYIGEALALNQSVTLPAGYLSKILARTVLSICFGFLPASIAIRRIGPLRRYATGLKEPAINLLTEGELNAQRAIDAPALAKEWPSRLLNPLTTSLKNWSNSKQHEAASWASFIACYGAVVTLTAVYGLIESGFMWRKARVAKLALLDSFMSSWPVLKAYVPDELHEKFEELYTTKFDLVKHTLLISNSERDAILQWVMEAKDVSRKKIKKPVEAEPVAVGVVS